ncbi:MAG: hypothetical protein D6712_20430 [Chloroflexi bacterium]|nr:MAG: hypothetical protein D6712_20430 [Chloroflexota bacterium]
MARETIILYRYARRSSGEIVDINNARKSEQYYCIECGCPMLPKKGVQKSHHFAHFRNAHCQAEGYLHKLSKFLISRKLQDHIRKDSPYLIMYPVKVKCDYFKSTFPFFRCVDEEVLTTNLTAIFDQVEVEGQVGDCRADILLKSSRFPEKSLLIEIKVSNGINEKKEQLGYPIIELSISSLNDLQAILEEDRIILHGNRVRAYNFRSNVREKSCCNGKCTRNKKAAICYIRDSTFIIEERSPSNLLSLLQKEKMKYFLGLGRFKENLWSDIVRDTRAHGYLIHNCWNCFHFVPKLFYCEEIGPIKSSRRGGKCESFLTLEELSNLEEVPETIILLGCQ